MKKAERVWNVKEFDGVSTAIRRAGWFTNPGVYALVGGQCGSEGKGVLSGYMGEKFGAGIDVVTTNAGANSGHTVMLDETKYVSRHIPCSSVVMGIRGTAHTCYINAGAIVDLEVLKKDLLRYGNNDATTYVVDGYAAVIRPEDCGELSNIGSTGTGTGTALARKCMREEGSTLGTHAEFEEHGASWLVHNLQEELLTQFKDIYASPKFTQVRSTIESQYVANPKKHIILLDMPQGYSLGINSGFYPYTTSRECTVAQGMSDLRIHPEHLRMTAATVRAFPIRVGNTDDGTSGPCYSDQRELEWSELGIEPELSTVTKRNRRIFTWSWQQYEDMLRVNRPNLVFFNFCNYVTYRNVHLLPTYHEPSTLGNNLDLFIDEALNRYQRVIGKELPVALTGWGRRSTDIRRVVTKEEVVR